MSLNFSKRSNVHGLIAAAKKAILSSLPPDQFILSPATSGIVEYDGEQIPCPPAATTVDFDVDVAWAAGNIATPTAIIDFQMKLTMSLSTIGAPSTATTQSLSIQAGATALTDPISFLDIPDTPATVSLFPVVWDVPVKAVVPNTGTATITFRLNTVDMSAWVTSRDISPALLLCIVQPNL